MCFYFVNFSVINYMYHIYRRHHYPRGRPPLRWADQIVNDTQLSLSDAVTATQDRPTWRSIVRDATCPTTQAN